MGINPRGLSPPYYAHRRSLKELYMKDAKPEQDRLLFEAIDLIIRLQGDAGNPVAVEMVQTWRNRSPLHETIWCRVADTHGMSGKILTARQKATKTEGSTLNRRNFMIAGAAGIAGLAATSYLTGTKTQRPADFSTARGEIRRIELVDGSIATLGPDSALAYAYTDQRREIELLAGMAYFEVQSDPYRPLSVASDAFSVTALGTRFDISNDRGVLNVAVDRGLVEIRGSDIGLAYGKQVAEGNWLRYDPAGPYLTERKRDIEQIAAWRDNILVAEEETVAVLVAKINRWYSGRILMADPFVGSQKVSGLFDVSNPQRALEAVVYPAGARVRYLSSELALITPI